MYRILLSTILLSGVFPGKAMAEAPLRSYQVDLPGQQDNVITQSWPGIGCWFWTAREFEPDGYKRFLDLHRDHSAFRLLTTSIRHPVEVTDPAVHDQIKRAAEYAEALGMRMVMDLDVRLAREAFQHAHPDEMQEIVCLREVSLAADGEVALAIESVTLGDHYTFRARPYDTISSRLLKVYAYASDANGISPDSVEDITVRCRVTQADTKAMAVAIPGAQEWAGKTACVLAAFTLFTPDVFAPHLAEFERGILQQYADVALAGACKDEWGFPGRFKLRTDELWYSIAMAETYAARRPGHDLVRDLLLMAKPEQGRAGERAAAINAYMEMCRERNVEIENAFYQATKDIFGPAAMSATHPTWYPYPGEQEVFKNGIDWWACRRDLAQTDETTPYAVRTALAKKWHSPLWYNMFYAETREPYQAELWSAALAGGRINFHPMYPGPWETNLEGLLGGELMRAECRVRLLNYISTAPVDCPIALIFGHPAALNWTQGSLGDTGVGLSNAFWAAGHYGDLIPSSEITSGALRIAADGKIQYGPQRYEVAVLYHPQFERPAVADFFQRAAGAGGTKLFRVGEWTTDFEGQPFDGAAALPAAMPSLDADTAVRSVLSALEAAGIAPQTSSIMHGGHGFPESAVPRPSGMCRLLDGTIILASGDHEVLGDPIERSFTVQGYEVSIDAIGIAAVRLGADGALQALAAGGLRRIVAPSCTIELPERVDLALWGDESGKWAGVLQGCKGDVPEALLNITTSWTRLRLPAPYVP